MTGDTVTRPLRLLVVDDHEVVRQGLVALLDRRQGFEVVAEAGTAAEAVEQARRYEPDIVVMDVRLPDGSGVEACREIRAERPATRVVMLTSYPDEEAVLSAIVAGASGYLLKQVRARDLVSALEAVGRGESLLDPAVTEKVLERVRRIATGAAADDLAALTTQEQKILLLVAEGKTNKEIASGVFLSDKTGQELRQLDPVQAQPGAASPGGGLHGSPTAAPEAGADARRSAVACQGSVLRVAVAGHEEPDRAAPDEVEGVGHERIHPVFLRAELDDRALRRREVDGLAAPALGVAASQLDPLLDDRVEDRADDVERAVDVRAGVEDEDPDPSPWS